MARTVKLRVVKPPAKRPAKREKSVEGDGLDALVALDCDFVKIGYEGWPDRLVIWAPGRHVWWEVKNRDGRLTPSQAVRLARLKLKGEPVFVGDSTEIVAWVKEQRRLLGGRA